MTRFPGYTVGDLGFRYETTLYDHPFILRFNVNNFTNAAYYASEGVLGDPRTFLATAEVKW
jgi:outer membrane receptor protein involved in Fe transport